ncbi:uncharacterized protein CEXT_180521 [Caerostris extrusa]|uniref:Uncharacterized protein n=1 Tax=Caerostris extrusa TaxID=172846 RepID=A0AAV4WY81_CAEEX|nr:uncharacterized protein CEXT_180521 [Caerostris extrusa]
MWFRNDPIPYLKISEARFEGLPSRAFVTLNVTRLQIKDSNMRWIAADAFSGMDSLLMLTLHNIGRRARRTSQFKKTEFSKNSLRRLGRSFRDLTNVQELYLQYNSIHELGTSLHNLRQVRNLNLSMNRLVILKYSNFEGLNSLENLDLSGNRITQINGAFHSLSNLRSLV